MVYTIPVLRQLWHGYHNLKALFTAPRSMTLGSLLPGTDINYQQKVGRGFGSSVVMAPVHWIARTFPQAVLTVEIDGEPIPDHGLTQLVDRPNNFYAGLALWISTIFSYVLDGNAYWLIVRDPQTLAPIELWYAPHWMIEPKGGDSGAEFVTHYEYRPRGVMIRLDPEDVIHFRYGLDPQNVRKGISPLASLWREIFTDDEASNFTAALLKNMGLAGVVISPASDKPVGIDELNQTRKYVTERLTGDRRGAPMVLSGATEIKQMAFSPQQMALGELRNVPEERVCAMLGIQPAVIGFGTGLQQTKVGAVMKEIVALAWHSNLIPMGKVFASELARCLLPEFEEQPDRAKAFFDLSGVEALQESANDKAERATKLLAGGAITRAQAKQETGFEVFVGDDVYMVPANLIEVPANVPQKARRGETGLKQEDFDPPLHPPDRRRLNRSQQRLRAVLIGDHNTLSRAMEDDVVKVMDRLGSMAEKAAREFAEGKDALDDAETIVIGMEIAALQLDLQRVGETHSLRIAQKVFERVGAELDLTIGMPDPVAQEIIAAGGRGMGLVDLDGQTRQALFRELEKAREEGLGIPEITRRIRDRVAAGRYTSPQMRARLIARTETKNAQRNSVLTAYRESGRVQRVVVVDNVTGHNDPDCSFWNGREVTLAHAAELGRQEHPNGTRDFVPVIV